MSVALRPGNVYSCLRGHARASTAEGWKKDLDAVYGRMSPVMLGQPGWIGSRRFWNLDNSREILAIGYYSTLAGRLDYEKKAAAGVRNDMETTLQRTPDRPKFHVVKSSGWTGERSGPEIVRMLTGKVGANSADELANILETGQEAAADNRPGLIEEHVAYSLEGDREVRIMEYYRGGGNVPSLPASRYASLLSTPLVANWYSVVALSTR